MPPTRVRCTMLAVIAAAMLTPMSYVGVRRAQAHDIQPLGAGTGWTLVKNLDGQGIRNTFKQTVTGEACDSNDQGSVSEDSVSVNSVGNLRLTTYAASHACAEVTSRWTVAPDPAHEVFIEWRASIPLDSWAALWLTGGPPRPTNGEIDVAEVLNVGKLCVTFHYGKPTDKHVLGGDTPRTCVDNVTSGMWHTYGVDWKPGSLTFYYDGVARYFMPPPDKPVITFAPEQVLMDVRNAGWVTASGKSGPNASLYVNYVRTWTRLCQCG
jgi:hypothetical protein